MLGPDTGRLLANLEGRRHRAEGCRRGRAHPCASGSLLRADERRRRAHFPERADLHGTGRLRLLDRRGQARERHAQGRSSPARASNCCRTATASCSSRTARNSCPAFRRCRRRATPSATPCIMITSQGKTTLQRRRHRAPPRAGGGAPAARIHLRYRRQAGRGSRLRVFDMLAAQRIPLAGLSLPLARYRLSRHGRATAIRYFPAPMQTVL